MSILPNFESSALESNALKTKRSDVTEVGEKRQRVEEKPTFSEYIKDKLIDSNKLEHEKDSIKLNKFINMTLLEQIYFPELVEKNVPKKDKFFIQLIYNIQTSNTPPKQRKKNQKKIITIVKENIGLLAPFVDKSMGIILEPDFNNARFHLFKTLANILDVIDLNELIEQQGYLMEKIWLMLVFLIMSDNSETKDLQDDIITKKQSQQEDMNSVLENESKQIIKKVYKKIGFNSIVKLFKKHINDETMADSIAMCISLCDSNDHDVLSFIKMAMENDKLGNVRFIGCKSIFYLSANTSTQSELDITFFLSLISKMLLDPDLKNKSVAILTTNLIISKDKKQVFDVYEQTVLNNITNQVQHARGKLREYHLRAMSSLLPMMDQENLKIYGEIILKFCMESLGALFDEKSKTYKKKNEKEQGLKNQNEDFKITVLLVIQNLYKLEDSSDETFFFNNNMKMFLLHIFFEKFWTRHTALSSAKLINTVQFTTNTMFQKVNTELIFEHFVECLKDNLEVLREMVAWGIVKMLNSEDQMNLVIKEETERVIIDALLFSFQDQKSDNQCYVRCFDVLAVKLGTNFKPYLLPIISTCLQLMSHKNSSMRKNAANLASRLVKTCKALDEQGLIYKLGVVFYENLGEPVGEVLQYVIKCIHEVLLSIEDIKKLEPPVTQLLPALTPILRNPYYGVSYNLLNIITLISEKCSDMIPPREWNRICNELLELFKTPIKDLRIKANDTFGVIAAGVGPQDIIGTLLNNLKMSERQIRLCSSIALAIVAKSCGTYTVLPVLLKEYSTPDTNIKNGILKALAFMFEYVGEESKDYVYLVVPMIQHALTDRNVVLRQTGATVVRSLAVSCKNCDCEDAFVHFLSLLIPNIFETSPHAIEKIRPAIDGLRVVIGTEILMQYMWTGLTHPSSAVRNAYYAVYNEIAKEENERLVPLYPLNDIPELKHIL